MNINLVAMERMIAEADAEVEAGAFQRAVGRDLVRLIRAHGEIKMLAVVAAASRMASAMR